MGKNYEGSEGEVRALDTYIKLIRAADSVSARIHGGAHLDGLTVSQFGVMEALFHLGPMCQRELGAKILKSSGNITMVIDNLEKLSLVERRRDQEDRRFVWVHLTRAGKRKIRKIFPRHVDMIKKHVGVLSKPQQLELSRLCRAIGLSNGS